jgi:hypothetical protein
MGYGLRKRNYIIVRLSPFEIAGDCDNSGNCKKEEFEVFHDYL